MSLVLDSSVTLAWVYSETGADEVRAIFDLVRTKGAWVPTLWRLEVANVLEMGVRRGRTNASFRDATLADLTRLTIYVDSETDLHAWGPTRRLAERHGLTLYDASYLELAQRRRLPLATLDVALRSASIEEGILLLPRGS